MKVNKQIVNRMKNAITKTIFTLPLVIIGCNGNDDWTPMTHMVFIDYTTSCNTMDEFNQEYVGKRILKIADMMDKHDELVIYPIHAFTESASPIIEPIRLPELRGDLADAKRKKQWKYELAKEVDKILNYQFDDRTLSGTNVFAAMRKVSRIIKNKKDVKIHFISDMVHEMHDMSFTDNFPNIPHEDVITMAVQKAEEYCPGKSLRNVDVAIYLPGKPSGGNIESLYYAVNSFWEEFFSQAGTSVLIKDLKA